VTTDENRFTASYHVVRVDNGWRWVLSDRAARGFARGAAWLDNSSKDFRKGECDAERKALVLRKGILAADELRHDQEALRFDRIKSTETIAPCNLSSRQRRRVHQRRDPAVETIRKLGDGAPLKLFGAEIIPRSRSTPRPTARRRAGDDHRKARRRGG
jgi:hypothetical protein